ncbi:MAG: NusG domain II-containing protein [Peptostreptococcaceae bacterium]|nr:NusG domain II-containing protein [Peptostreptococcaceae bacterium]
MKILKKGDYVIIFIVMVISFLPILFLQKEVNVDYSNIVVSQDGNIIGKYDLNKDKNSKYINFEFVVENKKYKATLESKDSKVRLLRLPKELVKKSIHEDMSWIEDDSKIIVALPVKLVVYIENSQNDTEVDAISS